MNGLYAKTDLKLYDINQSERTLDVTVLTVFPLTLIIKGYIVWPLVSQKECPVTLSVLLASNLLNSKK